MTLIHNGMYFYPILILSNWILLSAINKLSLITLNIGRYVDSNIKLVAEKIETMVNFEKYRDMVFDYFQGHFFARPEVIKQKNCLLQSYL
jgi:c-di-GMP-related signal transduction protein